MSIVSVYCVFADGPEAERIGRTIVEERLAACINILGPCRSIYRWNGKVEQAEEVPAILKTRADAVDALIARIAELHSYEVPAITVWPIQTALGSYAHWVMGSGG
jgi:periplasmic divalent cation tolerance protein